MGLINYINKQAKAPVVFAFSVISLLIFILSSMVATVFCPEWYGIIVGVILMISAIPFHLLGKKHKLCYLVSILLNAVANGFSVSAYYILNKIPLDFISCALAVLPACCIGFLSYFMYEKSFFTKKAALVINSVINGLVTIGFIALWVIFGNLIFSFGFFASLISIFYLFVFCLTIDHSKRNILRDISFGGFGAFILITLVVIVIISEGDALDGIYFDPGISTGEKKKKK